MSKPKATVLRRQSRLSTAALARITIGAVVLATTLDQLTKAWALSELADGHAVELLPTVALRLVFNPGVAFGMGAELGAPLAVVLLIVVAALTAWLTVRVRRGDPTLGTLALGATVGGAVGNLIDRIFRAESGPLTGHVVDFIAVEWFAIFNVADILTTCGMALWAISSVFSTRREEVRRTKVEDAA